MGIRFQQKRDTAANWTSNNPTLLSGEIGFETDTNKFKMGDGSTAWTSLDYVSGFLSKCSAYRNAVQSIVTSTVTKVQLNAEDYDIEGEFDKDTNHRFQPTVIGYYHVSCGIDITALANGSYANCMIYKNGALWKMSNEIMGAATGAGPAVSCDMYLVTTDYVELYVWHTHGSNRDVSGTGRLTFMDVHRFG